MKERNSFLFVFQLNCDEVLDWNDESHKVSVEINNEVEKGSTKLTLALPNRKLETYTSNWYFNINDFKTKGNKMFILRVFNPIEEYYPSAMKTD
jgi:hypothetical protein